MIKETVIGEFKRNHYEVMRFTLVEDEKIGKRYLDVRIFFRNGRGHLIPTQKGITLGAKRIQPAVEYLKQAFELLTAEDAEDSMAAMVQEGGGSIE